MAPGTPDGLVGFDFAAMPADAELLHEKSAEQYGDDDDDDVPDLVSPMKTPVQLSHAAPAFVPRLRPHRVHLFSAADQSNAVFECDLATATVQDIAEHAALHFSHLGDDLELLAQQGGCAFTDPHQKAIDVGIANNSIILVQPACPPVPPANGSGNSAVAPPQQQQPIGAQTFAPQLVQIQQPLQLGSVQYAQLQQPVMLPIDCSPQRGSRTVTRIIKVVTTAPSPGASQMAPAPQTIQVQGMSPQRGQPVSGNNSPVNVGPGQLGPYAATAEGSKMLVQSIESALDPAQPLQQLIGQLQQDLPSLCLHQHGSKVVRALCRRASVEQAAGLLVALLPAIPQLSSIGGAAAGAGSDAIVELMGRCTCHVTQQQAAGALLDCGVEGLCCTTPGRKLVLAALSHFPPGVALPLYQAIGECFLNVATDQSGCITLQRCWEAADAAGHTQGMDIMRSGVLQSLEHLLTDPFGNYVVQHMVKMDGPTVADIITDHVSGRLTELGCNKFASNVVERCIEHGSDRSAHRLISEVTCLDVAKVLVNDAYGNFVVQCCVDRAPPSMLEDLRNTVGPLIAHSPYGYRIEGRLQRRRGGGRRSSGGGGHGGRRGGYGGSPARHHNQEYYSSPPPGRNRQQQDYHSPVRDGQQQEYYSPPPGRSRRPQQEYYSTPPGRGGQRDYYSPPPGHNGQQQWEEHSAPPVVHRVVYTTAPAYAPSTTYVTTA
eukprot:TRINITY_DN18105_c0_g1_i1.p1 TRINITY_DN18105_c0_g1~~TRINITY_DN18105_c0_g1_i1.p1  ORF type:complete len:745 (+),score=271.09 TRINITY_DN18105_c0_g1_i1:96-2237(+)